jgi:glycosyltransferase involved in cell wall biosynthesis
MRLLLLSISAPPNVGGVETHLTDWFHDLQQRPDCEVHVLTYQPITTRTKGPAVEYQGNIKITRISWFGHTLFHRLETHPYFQFLYLAPRLGLAAILYCWREKPFTVVNAQGLVAMWVAKQLQRLFRTPILGCTHTVYQIPVGSRVARHVCNILQSTDLVLSCSQSGAKQLQALGLPEERIGTFTNWADQELFSPGDTPTARQSFAWPADRPVFLFSGRLIDSKGVALFHQWARQHPEFLFVSAGDGPWQNACEQLAKELSHYRHLGCLTPKQLAQAYRAADLLIVPSLYTEGMPRVIIEALSCGLPVVASNRGGTGEIVTAPVGWLIEPTLVGLNQALADWRQKGGTTENLRKTCREFAVERFSARNADVLWNALLRLQRSIG